MSLINMIASTAFHYYTSHLEYDGNSHCRMETDFHYCRSIITDHCDDSSGSATYGCGGGCCRGLDREHDPVRYHCAHDYCGGEYYFGNY